MKPGSEWLVLIAAGLLEVGWPIGLKMSQSPDRRISGIIFAAICMTASGALLWVAQRSIPIGTAYAVWTGIGATGTFLVGVLVYNDPATLLRMLSVLLIVCGIIGLKASHHVS